MGTINSAFTLISSALDADQAGLNVISNNVANASTTGYTRENPTWTENSSISINGQQYGQGVTMGGAVSQRDLILQERLNQQQQQASASSSRLTALDDVQSLFKVDSGSTSSTAGDIGSDLSSFFATFTALESNSSDNSLRQDVLSKAGTLASDISGTAASLNSQRSGLDSEAAGVTDQVNALTKAIASLNKQIMASSPNSDAGTLEDQRQTDIASLSKLIGINQVKTSKNGLEITTTSGHVLVADSKSTDLSTGKVNGMTDFFLGTDPTTGDPLDVTSELTSGGGSLGGYLTVRDQDIPNVMSQLDQLAYSVSTQINSLNNSGQDLNGNTGTTTTPLNIFSDPTAVSGAAAAMSVTMTDPNQIAAASVGSSIGDNSNAIAMATLSSSSIVNGQTPSDYYANMVSQVGTLVSEVSTESTAQTASVTQLTSENSSLSSVNLNDEASALTTLERSYQAASQVYAIVNRIMASALNLGVQTSVS